MFFIKSRYCVSTFLFVCYTIYNKEDVNMDKSTKALTTTFGLTILLFGFIIFLLYVIYCYAYYDKYQEQVYIDNINNNKYSFIWTIYISYK